MLQMKLDLMRAPKKKARSTPALSKARHRTAVEPERTRRDDEIRSLQTPIAHGGDLGDSRL